LRIDNDDSAGDVQDRLIEVVSQLYSPALRWIS